jgi:hypothetical protein
MVVRFLLLASCLLPLQAQSEEFRIYSDTPRLLLNKQRLRLLTRERERRSIRWQQFDSLITGGSNMPDPGFAFGLYYKVSGQAAWGKTAVDWALSDKATDLRQLALVYDWCGPAMTPAQLDRLGTKIEKSLAEPLPPNPDTLRQSARALAAIAIADRLADHGEAVLKPLLEQWWRSGIVKKLRAGEPAIAREHIYALFELLHAVRDNLQMDLREDAPDYFKALPTDHLESHYPATVPTADNEFRIPVYIRDGEPDLADAVISRAAELAMVAYDSNAAENQFVQGWLMQDRFLMRGRMGIPYEFLWANPYQPGLSYFQMPLVYHDALTGHLFARTSWDENATWLGFFDGRLQIYRDGAIQTLKPGASTEPVRVGDAVILRASEPNTPRFKADAEAVFVLGLTPHAHYDVEIDDQELREEETDAGGTLVLAIPDGVPAAVRVKRRAE